MTPKEEAEKILELHHGDAAQGFSMVSQNMSVLQTRGHILMTLAGVILSVSGFSGRLIAGTHLASQVFIVIGLLLVILSAVMVFHRVMRINWITRHLDQPAPRALELAIMDRDRKQKSFHQAGVVFFAGAVCYALALFFMLLNPHSRALTPRSDPNFRYENTPAPDGQKTGLSENGEKN